MRHILFVVVAASLTACSSPPPSPPAGGPPPDAVSVNDKGAPKPNQFWWPDQLDLSPLRQHAAESNPLGAQFDYAKAFGSLDLTAVKPAVRAVHEIRPGMSEAEVRVVIHRHFPEPGRFRRPEIGALYRGQLSFVLDPSDGALNAALVTVEFAGGKCVRAGFSPD